jgi:hypothetical protein
MAFRNQHTRMIVQIASSLPRHSHLKRRRITLVLSQRSMIAILLGLLVTDTFVILRHISINNIICTGVAIVDDITICSNGNKDPIIERNFPRIIFYSKGNFTNSERTMLPKRYVTDIGNAKARRKIVSHDDLDIDIVENDECQLQYTWQKTSFPTCNSVHEFDGTKPWSKISNRRQKLYRIIGNGFWRDVWIVNYEHGIHDEKGVLKTMRYYHNFTPRNFDRMRRDGITMERLAKSPFVVNIYAFCGTTSLTEFGDGGDIPDALWPLTSNSTLSQIEKLRIGMFITYPFFCFFNNDRILTQSF